ncbi:3-hydroxyisobutyrate dehydrogenase [Streptomyces sp. NPDC050619]|uniref:3-hydroxyisobutyrate dehydrogenase n=1 Tax=Streptomyces sp. NPDC050619 TaxID=3157214 RepID=UPI00342BD520
MKICWVGLGHMGLPMVVHLHRAGFDVSAFDVSAEARAAAAAVGLRAPDTLLEAAEGAEVIFTMLPTGDHVRKVLLESGLDQATAGAMCVDSSTISPAQAREISAEVAGTGRSFVDAPVSGGTAGAEDGTLTFMVGGTAEQFAHVTPLLEAMGRRHFHVGGTGCGQAAKLVNNMMLAMNMASVSEAAVIADRLGLDARTFWEIAQVSSGDSWVLRNFYPIPGVVPTSPASHDFAPGFTALLMRKDVGLALDETSAHAVPGAMTHQAARLLDQLIQAGEGHLDFSAVVRVAAGELPADTSLAG